MRLNILFQFCSAARVNENVFVVAAKHTNPILYHNWKPYFTTNFSTKAVYKSILTLITRNIASKHYE